MMSKKIRGVNLGGWLILEKWITPGVFKGTDAHDEYTFMHHKDAKKHIQEHRDTFITEKDFAWLRDHDINLVRIPIGYWLFEPIDGFTPTISYLDKAMQWAERNGIKVLIDLHGARGTQNGKDHSGKAGGTDWFDNTAYRHETVALLCKIAERYKDSSALWGIELLNEPQLLGHYFKLLRFYRKAYRELCLILKPGTHIVFHDGFHAVASSGALWRHKDYPVVMDSHWYAFYPFGHSATRYRKLLSIYRKTVLFLAQLSQPVIVGEWSSVFPGRYFEQLPKDQHNELLRQNIDMQLDIFKNAPGWIYWNYKHEAGGMWNYRSLVEQNIFKIK